MAAENRSLTWKQACKKKEKGESSKETFKTQDRLTNETINTEASKQTIKLCNF